MARVLVVLSAGSLVLGLLLWHASRAVVDSTGFADRAAAALEDPGVRSLIADEVAAQVARGPEAGGSGARRAIEAATADAVGSTRFERRFGGAVREAHRDLLSEDQERVTLAIAGVGPLIGAALERDRPRLARRVEAEANGPVTVLRRDVDDYAVEAARLIDRFPQLPLVPLGAAALFALVALIVSADKRRTLMDLGILVAVAGVLVVGGFYVLRWLAERGTSSAGEETAVRAVWNAFAGDVRVPALILAGAGAATAAAAALLLRPPGPYAAWR